MWDKGREYYEAGNYAEAVKWLSQAAEQGFVPAQYYLGKSYYHGFGVEQDYEQARYWFQKAAQQDEHFGEMELEEMDSKGL